MQCVERVRIGFCVHSDSVFIDARKRFKLKVKMNAEASV